MSMARGAVFSLLFAAAGAAGWAMVCHLTGLRLGVLAILIGGLAGFGMLLGARGRGRPVAGMLAALAAAAAVVGGRYAEHRLDVADWFAEGQEITEEEAIASIADGVWEDFDARGVETTWADDEEDESVRSCYPIEVWEAASRRWASMSLHDQEGLTAAMAAAWRAEADADGGAVALAAFVIGFGLFDVFWLGLAASTAYKIGATDATAKRGEHGPSQGVAPEPLEAPGAAFWGSLGQEPPPASAAAPRTPPAPAGASRAA